MGVAMQDSSELCTGKSGASPSGYADKLATQSRKMSRGHCGACLRRRGTRVCTEAACKTVLMLHTIKCTLAFYKKHLRCALLKQHHHTTFMSHSSTVQCPSTYRNMHKAMHLGASGSYAPPQGETSDLAVLYKHMYLRSIRKARTGMANAQCSPACAAAQSIPKARLSTDTCQHATQAARMRFTPRWPHRSSSAQAFSSAAAAEAICASCRARPASKETPHGHTMSTLLYAPSVA